MVENYIDEGRIQARIRELGEQISKDYRGKDLLVIGILNGAFMFLADLIRNVDNPMTLEFMKVSSYGEGTQSSGNVEIHLDLKKEIKDQHILLVEDIVDTGRTLHLLMDEIQKRSPASVKIASFLHKPAREVFKIPIEYLGFTIEDEFVVGYGLDFAGKYRELPYLGIYKGPV